MNVEEGKQLLTKYNIPYVDIEGIPTVDMEQLTLQEKCRVAIMRNHELKDQIYNGVHWFPTSKHDSEYLTMEGRGVVEYLRQKLMIIKND